MVLYNDVKKTDFIKDANFFFSSKTWKYKDFKDYCNFFCVQNAEIFFDSFDEYRLPLSCIKNTCVCTDHKVDI